MEKKESFLQEYVSSYGFSEDSLLNGKKLISHVTILAKERKIHNEKFQSCFQHTSQAMKPFPRSTKTVDLISNSLASYA